MIEFRLRNVVKDDIKDIFELSNDEVVRKNSINQEKISWEEHVRWFNEKLGDPNYVIYVVVDKNNKFIGQVKFEIFDSRAIVSISISSAFRGRGLSKHILKSACDKIYTEKPKIVRLEAIIKPSNISSIKIFKYAGFRYSKDVIINGEKFLKYIFIREIINN